ncbi:hypothetical protein [Acetobacter sp.]|uniref:hypothetical protein n=1 Tax=Acetobacter sp. TaxID=440 RepID=UPI0039E8A6F4
MRRHPAAPQDTHTGICRDVFGIGQVTQAATTAATTAAQMALTQEAMKKASRTGTNQAAAIGKSGEAAQDYLNPYVSVGNKLIGNMYDNSAYNSTDNSYVDRAENALTTDTLEKTPGYQWQYGQGMQAATNSAAARGLANSGAALKGASMFANGLADSTYQNQFNNQLAANSSAQGNLTNTFNRQNQLLNYGAQAAGTSASNATSTAVNSAAAQMAGVGASMAGTTAMSNSLGNGLNSLGNQAANYGSNYASYNNLINGRSAGSTYDYRQDTNGQEF